MPANTNGIIGFAPEYELLEFIRVTNNLGIHWGQVKALTKANLKSRYRKTIAGFIWVVMNPIIMFSVQSLVFRKFLKLEMPNYMMFLLSGLLPWIFISQSLEMCTGLFVNSGRVIKAFSVHPLVFLASQLIDNLINFIAAFTLVFIPLAVSQPTNIIGLLLLPICMLVLGAGALGMAWVFATLHCLLRDTRFVVTFVLSIGFFLTPVFYPREYVPEEMRFMVDINPIHRLIDPFRHSIYRFDAVAFGHSIGVAILVSALSLAAAYLLWRSKRNVVYLSI